MVILLIVAFISGLLTILAPCIWPILPIVLSASSSGGKRKPLGITLGILVSFSVFTLTLSYLVSIFKFDPNILRLVAVFVLTLLGVSLLIPRFSALIEVGVGQLSNLVRPGQGTNRTGFFGGLITGISLGIVWAPCAGPILASVAALAATQMVTTKVVLVTVAYMIGTGIPLFIFATVGSNLLTKSRILSPYLGKIQQFFGIVIIVTALLIWTNYDKIIQVKLLDLFPSYSNFLLRLEQNQKVGVQLDALSGRTSQPKTEKFFLPDLGPAPEIVGINNWLNSGPLTITGLTGKVILVDFWTYTCINCIRTLPYVTGWYEKYKEKGLVVIGVHTPEFEFEKKTENVLNAIKMFGVSYPVAQDNDYKTWNSFNNNYWPAKYLIDSSGHLRQTHFGEGNYEETELAIQALLAEAGKESSTDTLKVEEQMRSFFQTPETYLGTLRRGNPDYLTFEGEWLDDEEFSQSKAGAVLELEFTAQKVFLVITPAGNDIVQLRLDGVPIEENFAGKDVINARLKLDQPRLYELVDIPGKPGKHILRLEFETPGTNLFAFTFG